MKCPFVIWLICSIPRAPNAQVRRKNAFAFSDVRASSIGSLAVAVPMLSEGQLFGRLTCFSAMHSDHIADTFVLAFDSGVAGKRATQAGPLLSKFSRAAVASKVAVNLN